MIQIFSILFLVLIWFDALCQTDSIWNILILKYGAQPLLKRLALKRNIS